MNGLDKLNLPMATSALRANLNTALQNKLNQGKRQRRFRFFFVFSKGVKQSLTMKIWQESLFDIQ